MQANDVVVLKAYNMKRTYNEKTKKYEEIKTNWRLGQVETIFIMMTNIRLVRRREPRSNLRKIEIREDSSKKMQEAV